MSDLRPNIHKYFMDIAINASSRSTCIRRKVGAVAIDKDNYILSTGYNGVPKGMIHCTEKVCIGAHYATGEGLNKCESIHAEQNVIAHCSNPKEITTIYITTSPCMSCMKLILATNCRKIVFPQSAIYDELALDFFKQNGGEIVKT